MLTSGHSSLDITHCYWQPR